MSSENSQFSVSNEFDAAFGLGTAQQGVASMPTSQPTPVSAPSSAPETAPEEASAEDSTAPEQSTAPKPEEFVTVTDESGKRTKVKVDYSPEKVKKAYEMAAGMRKFQAERDSLKKEHESLKAQHVENQQLWNKFESAFQKSGYDGIIQLLSQGQETLSSLAQKEAQRQQLKAKDPRAYDDMVAQEQRLASEKARDAELNEYKSKVDRIEKERDEIELKSFQSTVNPIFLKNNFSGKLGDAEAEHGFNRALWLDSIQELNEYENQGHTVSPEMMEKVFSKNSARIGKYLNRQAEKKATAVIDSKKKTAKESAQAQVLSKTSGAFDDKTVDQYISKGDIGGLWNSLFARK